MTEQRNAEPSDISAAGADEVDGDASATTSGRPAEDAAEANDSPAEETTPPASPDPPAGAGSADDTDLGSEGEPDEPAVGGGAETDPPEEPAPDSDEDPPEAPATGEEASPVPPAGADDKPRQVPKVSLLVYGRTDVGQIRDHNEDNLLVSDLARQLRGGTTDTMAIELAAGGALLAVCDGMGGAAAGEIASQLAVDIVYERMRNGAAARDRDRLAMAMIEALEFAGVRILAESNKNRACRGMGTTATVGALVDDHLLLGQVGDSRAYILRDERLVQVTRDQSLVNQLIEAGQLTEEEAENFEHSNIILQALGTADAVQVDLTYVELRRDDILLLCSDGLSGMIRDDEIRDVMLRNSDPVEMVHQLIDEANDAGGHDNITAIVAIIRGDDLPEASTEDTLGLRYRKYPLPAWMDHRHVDMGFGAGLGGPRAAYDDTPYIEIHGEIELGPDDDWEDLFDDSPQIPTESGPSWSTLAIVAAVIGILVAVYLLSQ